MWFLLSMKLWCQVGLPYNESIVVRVTGCPNGCARPYMAELGLVGDGPNSYQVLFTSFCYTVQNRTGCTTSDIPKKACKLLSYLKRCGQRLMWMRKKLQFFGFTFWSCVKRRECPLCDIALFCSYGLGEHQVKLH